jgi:syntaxin-binding protein 5
VNAHTTIITITIILLNVLDIPLMPVTNERKYFPLFFPFSLLFTHKRQLARIHEHTTTITQYRLGQPGVDAHVRHEGESACEAVIQIEFLTNEGAFVTVTADDTLHLWNFQKKIPAVVHCLKFQRER